MKVDPRGKDFARYRCKHVNFVENSNVSGEREFLYAPYSVFTVESAYFPSDGEVLDENNPAIVELLAASDNSKEPEDLPLAPWY